MDDQSTDRTAYAKFYQESVPQLVTFLVSRGMSVLDAADCVQETLIDAWPVWATLKCPYAWCRTVAYRKACDLAKRGRREKPVSDTELARSPLIAPGAELECLEQKHQFLYWLRQLNGDREREVLAWTYDGATPKEIATALNMEPATVRSTLRNARAALRRLRAESGELG